MNQEFAGNEKKLNELQMELLKSLRHITTEKQIQDIRSLLRFYFVQQLDEAIAKVEEERGYTAETYEMWLQQNSSGKTSEAGL